MNTEIDLTFKKALKDINGKIAYIQKCLARGPDYSWNPSKDEVLSREIKELHLMLGALDHCDQINILLSGTLTLLKIYDEGNNA